MVVRVGVIAVAIDAGTVAFVDKASKESSNIRATLILSLCDALATVVDIIPWILVQKFGIDFI